MKKRPPKRGRTLTALVPVLALALSACGGDTGSSGDAGDPAPGGSATFAVGSDAGCVDPQQVGSNDTIWSVRQLVDSLTDQDPETGEIVPWLAESWEVSDDATSYTFHLTAGATFSDGTPVDASAVKANFDRIPQLGARGALPKGYLTGYQSTTVVDAQTVTVTFSAPNVQFLQATSTHSLGLLAPASVAQSDDDRCASVVGSGPFTLESYTPNESIVLAKRSGYDWGSSLWQHDGEAYLDKVTFKVVPESGVRTGSVQSGEVDAISSIGPQDEAALDGTDVTLQDRANPGLVFYLGFNHETPLGGDPTVRKAVSLAVDRKQVVDTVYTSQTKAATSILSSTTPMYTSQEDALGTDPDEAQAILEADGWKKGDDGIYAKDGQKLSMTVTWFNVIGTNKPTLELIQQQLKESGIDLQLKEVQTSEATSILSSGDFEITWANLTRADPDIMRSQFTSSLSNYYRLPASSLDDVLAAQAAAADATERESLVDEAQKMIVDNYDVVPVVELTTVLAHGPKIHDITYDASSRIQLFDTWVTQ